MDTFKGIVGLHRSSEAGCDESDGPWSPAGRASEDTGFTLDRRNLLVGGVAALALPRAAVAAPAEPKHARAISMWDFSWLERRWEGAGYEDWERALDELVERGYNALRIDPYPHLIANGPEDMWTLLPHWSVQDWGSPDVNRVQVLPALITFLGLCRTRGIKVGLSTWYRQDTRQCRMKITSPQIMADYWHATLKTIEQHGMLDTILYVDLCNEWPLSAWAPFFPQANKTRQWNGVESIAWMSAAIQSLRPRWPAIPLTFSFTNENVETYLDQDVRFLDLFEHHLWMAQANDSEFYKIVGYNYEHFEPTGYRNMSLHAEELYRSKPKYWEGLMLKNIDRLADTARKLRKPLITTECWSVVDYKDWPLLKWDWVKDLCASATERAAASEQWVAIATSNFCGPQFKGMWRDVAYHQRLTTIIKSRPIPGQLRQGLLYQRI
jgi:hypothetical protein